MKHSLKITIILVIIFALSQVVGLFIINNYVDHAATEQADEIVWEELPFEMERPQVAESASFVYILIGVLIGTLLVMLLAKFEKPSLWKVWFFIAVVFCLAVALKPFVGQVWGFVIGALLAFFKVIRPNVAVHNLSEVFIYGGLAAIFVPIMNIYAVLMLLALISAYDIYAVWKSRHMVALAKFQTGSGAFAGISIPYNKKKAAEAKKVKKDAKSVASKEAKGAGPSTAILGGGDIAFPLIFAGVVMKSYGFGLSFVIPVFTTAALLFLLIKSKEGKFYPAMPFISIGCIAGYLAVIILSNGL